MKVLTMKLKIILILSIIIILNSCKKDFSPITKNIKWSFPQNMDTTSHEFIWEIDTLYKPGIIQLGPRSFWGTDTNNVYMVGHSDDWKARVWHFNGKKWNADSTTGYAVSPTNILGFTEDDIWYFGHRIGSVLPSKIINYWDGVSWNVVTSNITNNGMSMWGTSSTNMFFGFDDGLIAHYNGENFKSTNTGTNAQINGMAGFSSNEIYAIGVLPDHSNPPNDTTQYWFFEFDGENWKINEFYIQSLENPEYRFPWGKLWAAPQNVLFGVSSDYIWYYHKSIGWQILYEHPTHTAWHVYGTDFNNIFTGGYGGGSIYHFNGSTWQNFDQLKNLEFYVWALYCLDDHVYIGGFNGYDHNGYIIRGKRK